MTKTEKFFAKDQIDSSIKIKVIGVGGGGGNAIQRVFNNTWLSQIDSVSFLEINTDAAECTKHGKSLEYLVIGEDIVKGRGSGGDSQKALECAKQASKDIEVQLDGINVVFIAASLGGGTGTGATPYIAQLAKQKGILTITVLTLPSAIAPGRSDTVGRVQDTIERIASTADSCLTIEQDRAMSELPGNATMNSVYEYIDGILGNAVQAMSELILITNDVNIDFNDISAALVGSGRSMLGLGYATGEDRIQKALTEALHNPLTSHLTTNTLASSILINIYHSADAHLSIGEFHAIGEAIQDFRLPDSKTSVRIGHGVQADFPEGALRLSVILSGIRDKGKDAK